MKFGDQQVPGSPFKVPVKAEVDASKVTASGPGVDPNNCRAAESLTFKVDAKKSAKAPLAVVVSTDKGPIAEKPVIKDNGNGTYDVTYKPPPEGKGPQNRLDMFYMLYLFIRQPVQRQGYLRRQRHQGKVCRAKGDAYSQNK